MISTIKGDDRKQEFLATALELFNEKGYEKTTIQDIIDRMGVSKGAFYHYFESKEDIIEKIAKEYAAKGISIIKNIAERQDLTAIEKLNQVIESVNTYKGSRETQRQKIKGIFKNEANIKLERKIVNSIRQESTKLAQQIIEEGIADGSFSTSDSKELAEFTLMTMYNVNGAIDELLGKMCNDQGELDQQEFLTKLEEKLMFYEEVFARVYKAPEGSIKLRASYLKRFSNHIPSVGM